MDEKLKSLLEAATIDGIPVIDNTTPDIWPCITFDSFSENGALFGAGKATEESVSYQVDIWYQLKTDNIKTVIKNIRSALKAEKIYSYPIYDYFYDKTSNMYHSYFTFDAVKESEE